MVIKNITKIIYFYFKLLLSYKNYKIKKKKNTDIINMDDSVIKTLQTNSIDMARIKCLVHNYLLYYDNHINHFQNIFPSHKVVHGIIKLKGIGVPYNHCKFTESDYFHAMLIKALYFYLERYTLYFALFSTLQ